MSSKPTASPGTSIGRPSESLGTREVLSPPPLDQDFGSESYLSPSGGFSDLDFSDYGTNDRPVLDVEEVSRWMSAENGGPVQYVDPSKIENGARLDGSGTGSSTRPTREANRSSTASYSYPTTPESLNHSSPKRTSMVSQTGSSTKDVSSSSRSEPTSQDPSQTLADDSSDGKGRRVSGTGSSMQARYNPSSLRNVSSPQWNARFQSDGSSPYSGADGVEQRHGLSPDKRSALNATELPSIEEQEKDRKISESAEGVRRWLVRGELVEEDEDDENWEEQDEIPRTPTPPISHTIIQRGIDEVTSNPNSERVHRWTDSPFDPETESLRNAPLSSSAAIERFARRARDLETASVAATYASSTRRRSETDMMSIRSATGISQRPSVADQGTGSADPRRESQSQSLIHNVLHKIMSRDSDTSQRKRKESHAQDHRPSLEDTQSNSSGSVNTITKVPSWPKPKPAHDASSRPGMSPNTAASFNLPQHRHHWSPLHTLGTLRHSRSRSRSDVPPQSPPQSHRSALATRWAAQGGPPVPNLRQNKDGTLAELSPISSIPEQQSPDPEPTIPDTSPYPDFIKGLNEALVNDEQDDEEEDGTTSPTTREHDIVETLDSTLTATVEGFKAHAQRFNPSIEDFLADRIAREQMKRYKVLVDLRRAHDQAVSNGKCEAGHLCAHANGPMLIEPRSSRAGDTAAAIFQVSSSTPNHEIEYLQGDETAQLANFPDGIPFPPVKQLPAQFECPLCFKVKKILKPSDWSKHCYEDLYPFVCSFPDCTEPKAFNRKADWARHESERHLKLETWTCNFADCTHSCHRRDNFVQHLVRAHKMQEEPRPQGTRRKAVHDDSEVSRLAEYCRTATDKSSEDEGCRFCGNYCNTWKKFAVHVAKHLVQVSLPMLSLIDRDNTEPTSTYVPSGMNTLGLPDGSTQADPLYGFVSPYSDATTVGGLGSSRDSTATLQDHYPSLTQSGLATLQAYSNYPTGQVRYGDYDGHMHANSSQSSAHTFPGTKNLPRQPSPGIYSGGLQPTYDPTSYPLQPNNKVSPGFSTSPDGNLSVNYAADPGQRTPQTYPPLFGVSDPQAVASHYEQQIPTTTGFESNQDFVSSPVIDENSGGDPFAFDATGNNGPFFNDVNPDYSLQQQRQNQYMNSTYPNTYNQQQYYGTEGGTPHASTYDSSSQYQQQYQLQQDIQQIRQGQAQHQQTSRNVPQYPNQRQ